MTHALALLALVSGLLVTAPLRAETAGSGQFNRIIAPSPSTSVSLAVDPVRTTSREALTGRRIASSSLAPLTIRALKRDAVRLIRTVPTTLEGETDLGCMAVAVYHEARNQTTLGQKAVASVVTQRALTPERWGDTACDVVRPVQFSFMTSRYGFPAIREGAAWEKAVRVALTIMVKGPMAELQGADHYHTYAVDPAWDKEMPVVAQIGDHIFFADPDSRQDP